MTGPRRGPPAAGPGRFRGVGPGGILRCVTVLGRTGRRLWEAWKRFGRRVGDFQARLLLVLFYFTVLAPFALVLRLTADPLALGPRGRRGWQPVDPGRQDPVARARAQF